MNGVQDVGARVEELLAALRSGPAENAAPAAEELVGLLVGLYGDGAGPHRHRAAGGGRRPAPRCWTG